MTDFATAEIYLWGQHVGTLVESEPRRVTFEYEDDFRKSGLEISPLQLPLSRQGPVSFGELVRSEAFLGLPGVFADALPDRFGNEIIKRYFAARGRPADAMSALQRLLYVGDRAMGALTFRPAHTPIESTEEALEVRALVEQARHVIEGEPGVAVPEIMQVGGSAGGARAKALVLWDRERNGIRSGHAKAHPGEEPWLIKFDGVTRDSGGLGMHADRTPSPWGRIEYVYSRMARDAGITMAETYLLPDGDLAHFMTRRFDRTAAGDRLHYHSLGGLQHVDFNDQFAFSYEALFDTIRALGLGQAAVDEAYRRMAFAIATVNFDDHVKNHGFVMDSGGTWQLSPAFDVTYAENQAWTRQHQMSTGGKFRDLTRSDLLAIGALFDVRQDGRQILSDVGQALEPWRSYATSAGVPGAWIDQLEGRFERW
jgi:serine/threonine-protein kinase HipA